MAGIGKLHRIAGEIDQDLLQPHRIAAQDQRQGRIDTIYHFQPFFGGTIANQVVQTFKNLIEIEIADVQNQLAGLDLGKIQDVVDDTEQMLRGSADLAQLLALFGLQCGILQQVGQTNDRIHRRADLMAHIRQKRAFGDVGHFRRLHRVRQLFGALDNQLFQFFAVMLQFFLHRFFIGNIVLDGHVMTNPAVFLPDRRNNRRFHKLATILAFVDKFAMPGPAISQIIPKLDETFGLGLTRFQQIDFSPHQLRARIAGSLDNGFVDILDVRLQIRNDDAFRALFDHQRKLTQLVLNSLAFGNVYQGCQQIITHSDTGNDRRAHLAIFTGHLIFQRIDRRIFFGRAQL